MKERKGIMPSRSLAKWYFGLMGLGFFCFIIFGIGGGRACSYLDEPTMFCQLSYLGPLFFIVLVFAALGLLVLDSFERGLFDD